MTGVKRDCHCPRARHQHGTHLAYIRDCCRCDDCRTAGTTADRARRRAKVYGRYDGLVDAEPARQHVYALMATGVGLTQITRLGGPSGGVLCKLMYGQPRQDGTRRPPSRRITPRVAQSILRIPLNGTAIADGQRVDATGTTRRLQALVALGWSQSKLARLLAMHPANFGKTIRATHVLVLASTARTVAELYDRLWQAPPPERDGRERVAASRARRHAREHRWMPPLAWDDDTIDDPIARPAVDANDDCVDVLDEIAVERIIAGDPPASVTKAERREAVRRMTEAGFSASEIAARLRGTTRTVQRDRAKGRAA